MHVIRVLFLAALCVVSLVDAARAQATAQPGGTDDGWSIAVYPIFAWVPLDIGIDVDIPPFNGDGGGLGEIVDSRFDGALFGGVAASNGSVAYRGLRPLGGVRRRPA
jgi:hypothetical protein